MRAFVEKRGNSVEYFFVMDERRPVLPMGLCGPFATRREAKAAASKLRAKDPLRELRVCNGMFFGTVHIQSLINERIKARADLKAMLEA